MTALSKQKNGLYEFGPFCLDATERLLLRDGRPVPLAPKVFDTLVALIETGGRLVTKDDLMSRLWPNTFVEEGTIARNISDLRKALGNAASGESYIETVPRHGYRFVATVRVLAEDIAPLIIEKHTRSRIITQREATPQDDIILREIEVRQRPAQEDLLQRVGQTKTRPRLNPTLLTLCALALTGLVVAVFYSLISRDSPRPQSILDVKSIAVLPFKTLGEDSGDEYLNAGLADALITRLSNIRQITVRPTSSVMKYTGREQDPLEAGRGLGVEAVFDGRIQKSGERVRVTVQLLRVSDGKPIWAARFEEKNTNPFALQDSISERLAQELSPKLSAEERERFAMRHTENPEAFQAYIRGRYWWNKRSGQAFRKAIDYFNQAIALDSNYALAYAGLADCYALLSPYSVVSRNECYPKAKESAEKALEIDEQLAEAHSSLAHITWLYDWNWAEAEREFKRAIELNPKCSTARASYSVYLSSMARHEEAIAEAQRAQELDPLSIPISEDVARAFYHARQYDQAILTELKTLELDPNHYRLNGWLEMAYQQKGLYDQAIEARLKAMSLVGITPEEIEAGRAKYQTSGWKGYWRKELELTKERAQHTYVLPYTFARICARAGDKDQAFAWLDKAYKEHSDHLVLIKVDPIFDDLRPDARYTSLLRRVGFE